MRHSSLQCPQCKNMTAVWQENTWPTWIDGPINGAWYVCENCKVKFHIKYVDTTNDWKKYKDISNKVNDIDPFGPPNPDFVNFVGEGKPGYLHSDGKIKNEPEFPPLHRIKEGEFSKQKPLYRKTDTPETKAMWDNVARIAASAPQWVKDEVDKLLRKKDRK